MALGLGVSLVFGDLAGAGTSSVAVIIASPDKDMKQIPGQLYDFNDTWDLDTATGLINDMYDYMPADPDTELELTYDEGYWNVDSGGDVQPIDTTVFPNPYNSEG